MQIISLLHHHLWFIRCKLLFSNKRKRFEGAVTEKLRTPNTKPELNAHTIKDATKVLSYTKKTGNNDVRP